MPAEVDALRAVQREDAQAQEAERRIAHLRQRQAQAQQLLDQAVARNQKLHQALDAKRVEGRRLSEEVDHLDDHIREQERKLANDIVSFKEMETIKTSIEHGHQHIDKLEEKALALLDEIEADAEAVAQKDRDFAERKARQEAELAALAGEIEAERARLGQIQQAREALWQGLPDHLRAAYQRLHDRVPDPLAAVEGQTCGGCKLQLSTQIVQGVREGSALVQCEHCGRILYLA